MATRVTLPETYYCGLRPSSQGAPLGFITPDGTDKAAQKRKQTVDDWAKLRYYGQTDVKELTPTSLKNVPLSGYKLTADIRNTNYGGYDKWRIIDPRGFELEITSGNLASLIAFTTIEQGEIHGDCIWGRSGANNVLLSVNSDDYKEAMAATVVKTSSESWKNVKPGYKITLQNGMTGTWLGKMYIVQIYSGYDDTHRTDNTLHVTESPMNIMIIEDIMSKSSGNPTIYISSSPKLSQILERDELTLEEAEKLTNDYIQSGSYISRNSGYESVMFMSFNKPDLEVSTSYSLEPINTIYNYSDLQTLCTRGHLKLCPHVFVNDNSRQLFGRISPGGYHSKNNDVAVNKVVRSELDNNKFIRGPWNREGSSYRNNDHYSDRSDYLFNVDAEYYYLNVTFKSKLNEYVFKWH